MSDQSSQAGPSSAPLFKKRSKAQSTSRISSSVIDDQPSTSLTPPQPRNNNNDDDDDDDDDDDLSVADLIALRSLSRKPTGIELERLNQGERRRKKGSKSKTAAQLEEERWEQQMKHGGLMDREEEKSDDDADASKPRRLVRKNNFQGETGTVDVDKHMMAYIQQEMSKRNPHSSANDDETTTDTAAATANPHDSLYALAEKYRQLQRSVKPEQSEEQREGNVALSSQMLTSVPEVDLGIDTRMNNIQQTEAAKRKLAEQQRGTMRDDNDSAYAQARFQHAKPRNDGDKRQMATDQVVLDRFRKRQRNFR